MKTPPVFYMAAAILAAGCGGSDPGATCGAVAPCGGNIAGQWDVVNACISRSAAMDLFTEGLQDSCPTATVQDIDLGSTGMMSFKADMTYAVALSLSGSITVGFPRACFNDLNCEQVGALLQLQLLVNPEPSIQSITCSGATSATVCSCRASLSNQATQENGTYSATGSTLATLPTAGTPELQQYCVQGGILHVVSLSTTMSLGPMGNATIASDVVAVRAK